MSGTEAPGGDPGYDRIYADLKAYSDAGMLDYVLPTDPIGEQWIVGWNGQILKFVTDEGIVGFLTGIHAGVLFAAKVKMGDLPTLMKIERMASPAPDEKGSQQ